MDICGIMFTITYQYYFITCFLFVRRYTTSHTHMKILLFIYFCYDMFFVHNDVSLGSWE